jgi:hypothetical protein
MYRFCATYVKNKPSFINHTNKEGKQADLGLPKKKQVEEKKRMDKKGQMGAMGIVVLAVTIMIGLVVVGYVYDALDLTAIPESAESAINDTLDNTTTGMTLLAVAIIVGAAVFILGIMGGR